ncbi:MAG: urease accessory protein UreF [Gammaproteobacteria bacterium]|nr:urease accessory protein UreF [Gammaproteobacteria bacterium]MDH5799770.1 urease accessory protein UreF [Gammaproteobacteria bacterium]
MNKPLAIDYHPEANLRLWQLISPSLPIGSYAYSQGLESACEAEWVHDRDSAHAWISAVLEQSLCRLDIPVLQRCYVAWGQVDGEQAQQSLRALHYWNQQILAQRETLEIKKEDLQLGYALRRLLLDLGELPSELWPEQEPLSYVTLFAYAAQRWKIPLQQAAQGYCWSWCENQVAAAIKLVPLGQTDGQRILSQLLRLIPQATSIGLSLEDADIGATLPGLAIGSAQHETQYSRLFRS